MHLKTADDGSSEVDGNIIFILIKGESDDTTWGYLCDWETGWGGDNAAAARQRSGGTSVGEWEKVLAIFNDGTGETADTPRGSFT
jgi:hypothetical protein